MKSNHKVILKSILLSSLAMLGTTPEESAAATISAISKKESDSDKGSMLEQLSSGVLSSYSESNDIFAKHGSHQSHQSHSSHVSSGSYNGSSSSGSVDPAVVGYTLGGIAATVGIAYLVKAIIKAHNNKVIKNSNNNRKRNTKSKYSESVDLRWGAIGNDIDAMIDTLIANGALSQSDIKRSKLGVHYKYNRAVKHGVKTMYKRMGQKKKNYSTVEFFTDLKRWKIRRRYWESQIGNSSISIQNNIDILRALAALLVEKGYLNHYDIDSISAPEETRRIKKAYHAFLKDNNLSQTNDINIGILALLYKLPNK